MKAKKKLKYHNLVLKDVSKTSDKKTKKTVYKATILLEKKSEKIKEEGVSSLISTSDGKKIANPKHFNRLYHKLKQAQKELSRKTKGSNNRHKARLKVAKIHASIKDARTDFLHKLTTDLVRNNSLICIEDLSVRNMVKNHKLARSISDASWGEMFRQLEYKCEWYGRELVKIDRFFPSSKRCNHCGFVVEKLPLDVRSWDCPSCGTEGIDRDINAGKNILAVGYAEVSSASRTTALAAGLAVAVCGADIRPDRHSSKARQRGLGEGLSCEVASQVHTPRGFPHERLSQDWQLRKTLLGKKQKPK